jgi:hypothetical protein
MHVRKISLISLLLLSACASHNWIAGPNVTDDFDTAKAKCSLFARGNAPGFYAEGNPKFVAGAAIGYGIGNAVRTQNDFNDCMLANGWKIADEPKPVYSPPVASVKPVVQTPTNSISQPIPNNFKVVMEACKEAYKDSRLDSLRPIGILLKANEYPTLEMRTNPAKITDEQKIALNIYDEIYQNQCLAKLRAASKFFANMISEVGTLESALTDLYSRKITIGEYATYKATYIDKIKAWQAVHNSGSEAMSGPRVTPNVGTNTEMVPNCFATGPASGSCN